MLRADRAFPHPASDVFSSGLRKATLMYIRFNRRRRITGSTLIDTLAVVLAIALQTSVALPLYLSITADSARKACRANMQTIANAVQESRVKKDVDDYSIWIGTPSTGWAGVSGTMPSLSTVPACPSGGTYSLNQGSTGDNTSFKVACTCVPSVGNAHSTFDPGVDVN